jgi:hypothetical protein
MLPLAPMLELHSPISMFAFTEMFAFNSGMYIFTDKREGRNITNPPPASQWCSSDKVLRGCWFITIPHVSHETAANGSRVELAA